MKTDLRTPKLTANDFRGEILRWYHRDGDYVESGADLIEFGTSKIAVVHAADASGYLRQFKAKGEFVHAGEIFAALYPTAAEAAAAQNSGPATAAPIAGAARFSRAAQTYAKENGFDLSGIKDQGLFTVRDVMRQMQASAGDSRSQLRAEPIDGRKRHEIEALRAGADGALVSGVTVQFSLSKKPRNVLPQVICESAKLIARFPKFAAWFENSAICYYQKPHIGVAIDGGRGLKVVTLRDSARHTPAQVEEQLAELSLRDLRQELGAEDVSDSSFTITDLSSLDILNFEPLLNGRQSAVLGIGGDKNLPGSPITLQLRFDHRVLSGREAAEFVNELKAALGGSRIESQ